MPTFTGTNLPDVRQLSGGDLLLPWTMDGRGGDDILSGGGLADVIRGGEGDDLLTGGAGNDILYSDRGFDTLLGGDGADILWIDAGQGEGGAGNDIIHYGGGGGASAAGGAVILGGDGADVVYSRGYGRIDLGAGNDRYYAVGVDGDAVDGGYGADSLHDMGIACFLLGGFGNDIFYVASALSEVVERANAGYDIVRTALETYLPANIEAVQLEGATDVGVYGNQLANNLQGNSGDNVLSGDGGVDTLSGGDGNDEIIGGAGNDLLRGGAGADSFLVTNNYSTVLETDQVYDFSTAEGDRVDLSFAYNGVVALVSAFTKAAGQMTLTFASGTTTLRLDFTGDGRVDYQMKINGDVTGDSGGWLL